MNSGPPSPRAPDPFARHRVRIITVSGDGRVTADALQPWSAVTTTNIVTGEAPNFPAAEIPSGVIERTADGWEILMTVDGLRLELDGLGHACIHDEVEEVGGPGIFMLVELLPAPG